MQCQCLRGLPRIQRPLTARLEHRCYSLHSSSWIRIVKGHAYAGEVHTFGGQVLRDYLCWSSDYLHIVVVPELSLGDLKVLFTWICQADPLEPS